MSIQDWAVAIGLLTPLVLGILAFVEKFISHKKKNSPTEQETELVQGMTVPIDFGAELVKELRKDAEEKDAEIARLKAIINYKKDHNE